jgi:hypothetical protein
MYLAQRLVKRMESETGIGMLLENSEDGLVGMLPVFSTKAAARKWYGKDVKVRELELDPDAV